MKNENQNNFKKFKKIHKIQTNHKVTRDSQCSWPSMI